MTHWWTESSGRQTAIDLLLIVAIIAVLGAENLLFPFSRDQGIHALIAYAMDGGRVPYLDTFNMKPPLTTLFHWLSQQFFGHSMRSIRIFDLVICQLIAVLIYFLTRRILASRPASIMAGVFFGLLYYSHDFWHTSQTDGWTSLFIVSAALLLTADMGGDLKRSRRLEMLGAGALTCLAFWLKYPVILVGIVIFAARLLSPERRRHFWPDVLFFTVGIVATMAAMIAFLAAYDAAGAYFEIQLNIRQYVTISSWKFNFVWPLARLAAKSPVVGALIVIGLITLLMALRKKPEDRYGAVFLLFWSCAGAASGLVQGKGFYYHYLPVLPPLSIVAAVGVSTVWKFVESKFPGRAGAPLAMTILALALIVSWLPFSISRVTNLVTGDASDEQHYMKKFVTDDYDARDMQAVANYINQHSEKGETLFLWGWGTGVYFLTEKVPISRFIYTWPLVAGIPDGKYRSDLMHELRQNTPDIFVVESADATPHVLGHEKDSAAMLQEFETLQSFLNDNYRREARVGRFAIYRKK